MTKFEYFFLLVIKEDYRKLEVLAFEMETTIASLEEELASARAEKEQAASTIESLDVEMQSLSDKLLMSNSELSVYEEAVSTLVRICFSCYDYALDIFLPFKKVHIDLENKIDAPTWLLLF